MFYLRHFRWRADVLGGNCEFRENNVGCVKKQTTTTKNKKHKNSFWQQTLIKNIIASNLPMVCSNH